MQKISILLAKPVPLLAVPLNGCLAAVQKSYPRHTRSFPQCGRKETFKKQGMGNSFRSCTILVRRCRLRKSFSVVPSPTRVFPAIGTGNLISRAKKEGGNRISSPLTEEGRRGGKRGGKRKVIRVYGKKGSGEKTDDI